MAPRMLYSRLDDLGGDFSILYPALGLALPTIHGGEVRQIACRALNTMNAEICGQFRDRIAPAAAIPMHTPDEAIAELENASRLGWKVEMIPRGVARPIPALESEHPDAFPNAAYFDCYGLDSFYDYDRVWRKFVELKTAVTSHGGVGLRYLPLGRRSPTNYMFNHIGAHAYQQGELCRSIVMGGVATRFPELAFGFLECGAGWACDLLHSLEEHWEKRNVAGLVNYDPSRLDRPRLHQLLAEYGGPEIIAKNSARAVRAYAEALGGPDPPPERAHKARTRLRSEHSFARIFGNILL